ncbi:MAG: LemA family protein [Pseudomonadota bacterium]
MSTVAWIILAIIVFSILGIVFIYNSLISKKNNVKNAFSTIDVLLKMRYDLIPNLISSVQEYMKHEAGVLTKITELRAKAINPSIDDNEKIKIDNELSRALGGIMVAVENYPDLKASNNFIQLQQALNEVEEKISAGRRTYNACVTDFNNALQMFPSNIIASRMNLKEATWIEIEEAERKNVDVKKMFAS